MNPDELEQEAEQTRKQAEEEAQAKIQLAEEIRQKVQAADEKIAQGKQLQDEGEKEKRDALMGGTSTGIF